MTLGSLKVDARSNWPLFHVHPNGLPFIIQRKSGLFDSCANKRALWMSVCHGICNHDSSLAVGSIDCTRASSAGSRGPALSKTAVAANRQAVTISYFGTGANRYSSFEWTRCN